MLLRLRCWLLLFCVLVGAGAAAEPVLQGAGATFPAPVYLKWATDYERATGRPVRYDAIGSVRGVERIERGDTDFAATDVPLDAEALQRGALRQFPAVIGAVVPVVNIAGIRSGDLRLSGEVLAGIYLGQVRRWNDPAIASLNPGLVLPSSNITVVHRADPSGSSFVWSGFLSRASTAWRDGVGTATLTRWPVGVAESGNEGVASSVQRTKMAIGYVEYAYARAHRLSVASLRNRDGAFVVPERAGFEAAVASARWRSPEDLMQPLTDVGGAGAWPLTSATYVLVSARPGDAERRERALQFFEWAWAHDSAAALSLDYVPLPAAAIDLVATGRPR